MAKVSIPSITIEHEGVVYAAEWRDDGTINYKGMDKSGNEVSSTPETVMSAARSYGASFGSGENKDDTKQENAQEKGLEHFEIDTDGKGNWTLKSGDKSKLSAKQLEWCEMMAKNAVGKEAGSAAYGSQGKADGKKKNADENDSGFTVGEFVHSQRNMWNDLKKDFKKIGQGVVRDMTDLAKTPFQMARDVTKFGAMIAQGRFKEATGKAANRISDNLKAILGDDNSKTSALHKDSQKSIYGTSNFINRNITKPVRDAVRDVKAMGKRLFGLSGRTGLQAVKSVARGGNSNTRGKDGGR